MAGFHQPGLRQILRWSFFQMLQLNLLDTLCFAQPDYLLPLRNRKNMFM